MTKPERLAATVHNNLTAIALELLDGKFGSIKYDPAEVSEIVVEVRVQFAYLGRIMAEESTPQRRMERLTRLNGYVLAGLAYVSDEAPQLDSVPFGWITGRDVNDCIEQPQTGNVADPWHI